MKAELFTLHAIAATRRAAGQPCNPMRDPVADIDWLTEDELQRAHWLGFAIELNATRRPPFNCRCQLQHPAEDDPAERGVAA